MTSTSPVALPNENLLQIFLYHVAQWEVENGPPASYEQKQPGGWSLASSWHGWMSIAWVCRRWRGVALHAPELWTKIYVREPLGLLEAYLARSKNKPLTVVAALLHSTVAAWRLVLDHAQRVKALFLDCRHFTAKTLAALTYDCDLHFPNLRHLNLYERTVEPYREVWPPLALEPHEWSSGEMLEVTHAPFVHSSQLFCGTLRKLSLSNMRWDEGPPLDVWKNFFEALSTLYSLQELHILNSPPPLPNNFQRSSITEDSLGTSPVVFPKLQLLEVFSTDYDGPQQAELLITHVSAPAGIAIHVTLSYRREISAGEYKLLTSAVGAELVRGGAVLRTLSIEHAPSSAINVLTPVTATSWDDADTPLAELTRRPSSAPSKPPLFTISIPRPVRHGGIDSGSPPQWATHEPWSTADVLCTDLPLDGLERFAIASWPLPDDAARDRQLDAMFERVRAVAPPDVTAGLAAMRAAVDRLPRQLARARALRVLSVSGPFASRLVDDLVSDVRDAEPLFPSLEELHLARFGESQAARCAKSLARSLESRRASPAKNLRRLVLDDPEVDDDAAALVKDVVEGLTCIRRDQDGDVWWRRSFRGGSQSDSQKM